MAEWSKALVLKTRDSLRGPWVRIPLPPHCFLFANVPVLHTADMLYFRSMRTTQRKGDIATTQCIATFTKLGYDVLLPVTESAPYDLAVETDNKLFRVQVKFSSNKEVDLRNIHSNAQGYVVKKTQQNTYDWLYVLMSTGEEFLVKECLAGRRSITFHNKDYLLQKWSM
jgi:hypothetical protein